jgi:phenylalanyl-tRNA synthetase alpha subunit
MDLKEYSTISIVNAESIDLNNNCRQVDNYYIYDYSYEDLQNIDILDAENVYEKDFVTFLEEIKLYFNNQGFKRISNNIFTTDYYNYELLDIPATHPDRNKTNAFYTKTYKKIKNYVDLNLTISETTLVHRSDGYYSPVTLAAHTTANMWANILNNNTTDKNYLIGTSIRREREDAKHQIEFYSLELLVEDTNFQQLENTLIHLFNHLGLDVQLRRTRYPYVEPAVEIIHNYNNTEIELGGGGIFTLQLCKIVKKKGCVLGAGIGLTRLWLVLLNKLNLKDLNELN